MNTETANTKLYEKMFEEQEKFRGWLLSQPPKEILNHTYEYTTREDILMTLENNDLRLDQAQALLSSPTPLADVFKEFENRETDYMDVVRDSMESRANTLLRWWNLNEGCGRSAVRKRNGAGKSPGVARTASNRTKSGLQ